MNKHILDCKEGFLADYINSKGRSKTFWPFLWHRMRKFIEKSVKIADFQAPEKFFSGFLPINAFHLIPYCSGISKWSYSYF